MNRQDNTNDKKWLIVYSSITGNTKQIAEAMYNAFEENEADIYSINDVQNFSLDDFANYNNIIVGYWLIRGGPDNKTQDFLTKLHNKTVVLFQTQGAYLNTEHSVTAFAKAAIYLNTSNKILGTFASQGKFNLELLAKHHKTVTKEQQERWEIAKNHPNEEDFQRAKDFIKAMKAKLIMIQKFAKK